MPEAGGGARRRAVQDEFERAAELFAERTAGRFDDMGVVEFSRAQEGWDVLEVAAGTGNFLSLFSAIAGELVALDLTHGMLRRAAERYPEMQPVVGDGNHLPIASRSVDLVTCAQAFHHMHRPLPVLQEMRRVVKDDGYVLVVDQVAPERFEEAVAMNEMEVIRDPSHASSRPPSAFRLLAGAAALRIVDERLWEGTNTFSRWMWPGEFPAERIDAVRRFVEERGAETGMGWRREGDDWVYTRRRIMLLLARD